MLVAPSHLAKAVPGSGAKKGGLNNGNDRSNVRRRKVDRPKDIVWYSDLRIRCPNFLESMGGGRCQNTKYRPGMSWAIRFYESPYLAARMRKVLEYGGL